MKLLFLFLILGLLMRTPNAENNDLQKILTRLYSSAAGDLGCCSAATRVAETMQGGGGWADINYKVCDCALLFCPNPY